MPPAPQLDQLKRLCAKPETYNKAQALLHIAAAKTGPGSGHDLGAGTTGLAAICALVASLQLRNSDVSEAVAQKSSCLAPNIFKTTLATVRSILVDSEGASSQHGGSQDLSYQALLKHHAVGGTRNLKQKLLGWMAEAEGTVLEVDRLQRRYEGQTTLIKCAIFSWTCTRLRIERESLDDLVEENGLSLKSFAALLKTLDKACDALGLRMSQEVDALRWPLRSSRSVSPTKTPQPSPSKTDTAPRTENLPDASSTLTPKRRPEISNVDDEFTTPSPTKKQKTVRLQARTPVELVLHSIASTSSLALDTLQAGETAQPTMDLQGTAPFLSPCARPTRTPTKQKLAQATEDADDTSETDEFPQPRRFRPVFLDQKQWFLHDSRLEGVWREAEAFKQEMMGLYGHSLQNRSQASSKSSH